VSHDHEFSRHTAKLLRKEPHYRLPTFIDCDFSFLSNDKNDTSDNMAEVTLRTRKFIRNPLLGRKQMVV